MSDWIKKNLNHKYKLVFVFANTGKEREESLVFADRCDKHFGLNLVWVEAITDPINGKGVKAKVVSFETASRNGEPFEAAIAKHGIPNQNRPLCSRELKTYAIRAYARQMGYKKYLTAIGIRVDEIDRMNPSAKKEGIIYPLISMKPTRKTDVNQFWSEQPFDLGLKSYQGNCDACWKKSLRKLLTVAKENPAALEWWSEMERKYENFTPASRLHNPNIKPPHRFFRNNLTAAELLEMSKAPFVEAKDESKIIDRQQLLFEYEMDTTNGCEDSCEPF